MNNKKGSAAKALKTSIITSLACLVTGILMTAFPESVKTALSYVVGAVLLVYGIFNIISFFISTQRDLYIELIAGVIAAAVGIFSLLSPNIIVDVIFIVVGILIIIDSLLDIKHSFALRKMKMKFWWIYLILSCAVILLGLATIIFKSVFQDILMVVLGILLIYQGVSGFSILILAGHFGKKQTADNAGMIEAEAEDVSE